MLCDFILDCVDYYFKKQRELSIIYYKDSPSSIYYPDLDFLLEDYANLRIQYFNNENSDLDFKQVNKLFKNEAKIKTLALECKETRHFIHMETCLRKKQSELLKFFIKKSTIFSEFEKNYNFYQNNDLNCSQKDYNQFDYRFIKQKLDLKVRKNEFEDKIEFVFSPCKYRKPDFTITRQYSFIQGSSIFSEKCPVFIECNLKKILNHFNNFIISENLEKNDSEYFLDRKSEENDYSVIKYCYDCLSNIHRIFTESSHSITAFLTVDNEKLFESELYEKLADLYCLISKEAECEKKILSETIPCLLNLKRLLEFEFEFEKFLIPNEFLKKRLSELKNKYILKTGFMRTALQRIYDIYVNDPSKLWLEKGLIISVAENCDFFLDFVDKTGKLIEFYISTD